MPVKSSASAAEQEPSYAALASISTRSCPNGIPPRDELLLLFDREIDGLLKPLDGDRPPVGSASLRPVTVETTLQP